MQIEFHFRNLDSSDALKAYATGKITKLGKYLRPPAEAHVTFSVERHMHCVDVAVNASGEHFQGRAEEEDMYASIDVVIDKVMRQATRSRGQNNNHRRGPEAADGAGE